MITWISTLQKMLRLYSLYGRSAFREFADCLSRTIPFADHTLFEIQGDDFRVIATSIRDADEREFLANAIKKEVPLKNDRVHLENVRTGIKSCITIVLEGEGGQKVGYWVVESRAHEKLRFHKRWEQYRQLLSVLIQAQQNKESVLQCIEMDEESGVSGKKAFERVICDTQKQGGTYQICVFRRSHYREDVASLGNEIIRSEIQNLIRKLQRIEKGRIFTVSEDTVALVTNRDEKEIYANINAFAERNGLYESTKIAFLSTDWQKQKDIFQAIEIAMEECHTGIIWRQGRDGLSMLHNDEGSEIL